MLGYSGHGYMVIEILHARGRKLLGYCEHIEKDSNPYQLAYLGLESETVVQTLLQTHPFFTAIGDNRVRRLVSEKLVEEGRDFAKAAISPFARVSETARIREGAMIGPGAVVNAQSFVGRGTIINTSSIIEHECRIGDYAHIGPGAVLTGNVTVGDTAFVGAGAVTLPGITIGEGAIIGAGAVVLRDVATRYHGSR